LEAASPTMTRIVDNILYFKSVKDHEKDKLPAGSYSIYYGSDNIKYIHATPIGSNYGYIKYPQSTITSVESSPGYSIWYSATPSTINLYQTEISKTSTGYYKLGYFNDGVDWLNLKSTKPGAKIVGTFNGPRLRIHGLRGPDCGKIKIRITTKQVVTSDVEAIVLDWFEIDCFSLTEKETIIFEKTNLEYLEYNIEIETLEEKNILSTSSSVKVTKISFLRNFNLSLDNQIINPDLSFKSIGGVR
jgi:hypothetical protein